MTRIPLRTLDPYESEFAAAAPVADDFPSARLSIEIDNCCHRQGVISSGEDQLRAPDVCLSEKIAAGACHFEETVCGIASSKRKCGIRIATGDGDARRPHLGRSAVVDVTVA